MGSQVTKTRKWAADDVKRWKLDKIKPYARNARLHSDEQIEQIAESMKRFGVTAPVLVDEEGVLIYGHGRLRAAQLLGLAELPVAVARGWTEDEKRAYRITDNQVALNSEWDLPTLKLEIEELKLKDFDTGILAFEPTQLDKWFGERDPASVAAKLEGLEYAIIVRCTSEQQQGELIEQFQKQGLRVEAMIS